MNVNVYTVKFVGKAWVLQAWVARLAGLSQTPVPGKRLAMRVGECKVCTYLAKAWIRNGSGSTVHPVGIPTLRA